MDKISELMDGELPRRESKRQISRLEEDPQLSARWDTYHLIRDALREQTEIGTGFARRMHVRLEQEPAIFAPHMRLGHRFARYTLPLAAGAAGVAVVAWLTLSALPPEGQSQMLATKLTEPPASVVSPGVIADYLVAHQEFSPRTAMQGVASYVRTVAADETSPAR